MAEEKKQAPSEQTKDIKEKEPVSTENAAQQAGDEKPEKKDKKKAKKDSETEALKKEIEVQKELLIRTAAEFDNYKKRTEREKAGISEFARAGIVKKLLPILDNVDRAAAADRESADYLKGVEMIIKQFEALAGDIGITEVAAVGDAFDPTLHEAVMHIEDESLGENVITEVLQKGYKLGDTVVRAAMVKVAN